MDEREKMTMGKEEEACQRGKENAEGDGVGGGRSLEEDWSLVMNETERERDLSWESSGRRH